MSYRLGKETSPEGNHNKKTKRKFVPQSSKKMTRTRTRTREMGPHEFSEYELKWLKFLDRRKTQLGRPLGNIEILRAAHDFFEEEGPLPGN